MSILLIDGVKCEEWTPKTEDDFERVVKDHAKDIFGEQSEYFEIKHKLKSKAGKGSIPDGFAVVFGAKPRWHIVEIELSSHAYEHIAGQLSKFINGITNATTQKDIVDVLYNEIDSDEFRKLRVRKAIGTTDIHKFLADLISEPAMLTIVIEKHTEEVDEALNMLAYPPQNKKVVEFQTFAREGVGLAVHTHLFEPLYLEKPKEEIPTKPSPTGEGTELTILEHTLKADELKYKRFRLLKDERPFFPPVGQKFQIKADGDSYTTNVSDEKPPRMRYLKPWFRKHSSLKPGDKVTFRLLAPNLYQLTS